MASKSMKYDKKYNYKKVKKEIVEEKKTFGFGYKSALIILLTTTLTTIFLPLLWKALNIENRLSILILNALCIPAAVCYCQFFVESKKGITKSCKIIFTLLTLAITIICYFWLYSGVYV